jgi:hypothetical protein
MRAAAEANDRRNLSDGAQFVKHRLLVLFHDGSVHGVPPFFQIYSGLIPNGSRPESMQPLSNARIRSGK